MTESLSFENLSFTPIFSRDDITWSLKFTGIPVLIHDLGNTKSRNKRQIQLCLVEKGSGFVLWKDVIDHLTKYQVSNDYLFHTMHLSNDHSKKIGLSFDASLEAREFHDWLNILTSDPANISLRGPSNQVIQETKQKYHFHLEQFLRKSTHTFISRQQHKTNRKSPDKSDISSPCGFEHLVSIGSRDYAKFFSLQTFVNTANIAMQPKKNHGKNKARPAPQPPKRRVS